eukprot:TRINITY_DN64859_c0_g1_i1.p2 TRINITY_DN64859_c0_g1~~TRINITY_DN64859_c0_g1_i1.p2  ORF type:complete len:165 (+),score=41.74 TRINITY_DN64859_c0_g1_i1:79-573(+)
MLASRCLRASKFVVGVGVKDIEGTKVCIKKAINMARPGDTIVAVNVPCLIPEMLLSSMSDPADATEDDLMTFAKLPSVAGAVVQKTVKDIADAEMKRLNLQLDIQYKVEQPSSDVKTSILGACKTEAADFLLIGPGVGGKGRIPPYVAARARGLTVCVVRDGIE